MTGGSADRRVLSAAAMTMILAMAAPCASGPSEPGAKPLRTLTDMREAQLVRQHWDLSCGAAAVATLLTYQLAHPVSERQVALGMLRRTSPLLVRRRLGFSLLDLKRYAVSEGFAADGYAQMSLDDLAAMAPAIVPIRAHGFRHFVVFRGRRADRVLLADPAFGNRTMPADAFQRAWANGVGFVVYDLAQPRAPNRMGAPTELFLTPADQAVRASTTTHTGGGL
jgi:predicted double-glycine peptidase